MAAAALVSWCWHVLWEEWIGANVWRTLFVIFLLANLKALPLMWHVRLFSVLANHLYVHRSRRVSLAHHGASALFEPIVTTSASPLLEIDFNLHKSNATFYTDLDINRIHLLTTLFKRVIDPSLPAGPTRDGGLGGLTCALGAVSCTFRREIKPYERYEIWSRVLCWDDKWLYIASHFVRADAVRPLSYRLTTTTTTTTTTNTNQTPFSCSPAAAKRLVLASAISKYVFKQGRRTIPPEVVLRALHLLPLDASPAEPPPSSPPAWDAARVLAENRRGLRVARHLEGLEALDEMFSGDSVAALGKFGPWPW